MGNHGSTERAALLVQFHSPIRYDYEFRIASSSYIDLFVIVCSKYCQKRNMQIIQQIKNLYRGSCNCCQNSYCVIYYVKRNVDLK